MKHPIAGKHRPELAVNLNDARGFDAQYGLPPVIEPSVSDGGAGGGMQFHLVECPYCGECSETPVDTSSGSARYVEDFQICCQPIEFSLEVDSSDLLQSLSTVRSD